MRFFPIIVASVLSLSACSTAQTSAVSAAVSAVSTLVADITADVAAAEKTGSIPASSLQAIQAQITALQTDVGNLGTGGTTAATVLADVSSAVSLIGPFVPEIEALIAAATPLNPKLPTVIATHYHTAIASLTLLNATGK